MSYPVPNSNFWSPLMHQRSYHARGVLENLLANITYLVYELKKLKSSFPIDMTREDANKEEKLMERSIEKFRLMSRQVRKSKREITGMLEDGVYVNPRNYDRSKYSAAASLDFEIQERVPHAKKIIKRQMCQTLPPPPTPERRMLLTGL